MLIRLDLPGGQVVLLNPDGVDSIELRPDSASDVVGLRSGRELYLPRSVAEKLISASLIMTPR